MSYRKIEVSGLECEYTIGRTHVKVKIPGQKSFAISKEQVGKSTNHGLDVATSVTPADVKALILSRI